MPERFGVELGRAMTRQRVTFRELGRRTGLSPSYLNRIANQRRPPPASGTIELLAEALELEPTSFFEYRRRLAIAAIDENERLIDRLLSLARR